MTGREMAKRSTYGGEYYYTSTTMKRISTQAYIALARPPDQRRKVALDLLPHAPTETLHLHRLRDGELGEVRNAGLVGDDGTSVVQLGAVDGQNVVLDRLEEVGNHRRPERLLEQPECRLDACNVESCTALHWASAAGSNASVKALVARKANVNVVDGAGRTPLHYASKAGVRSVVQCLIVALADINAVTTRSRDTPLHVAIEYRRLDVVKCLLEFGARKDVVDRHGHSPIDRASVSDAELAALLRDYGTCDSHTLFRSISSTRP